MIMQKAPGKLVKIEELPAVLPATGRLMGLDIGTKTIGVAISDHERRLAQPLTTLPRGKWSHDLQEIRKIIEAHAVIAIIAGWPLNMDGTEGQRCQGVRQVVKNLQEALPLFFAFQDERLSSFDAEDRLREASSVPKKGDVDRAAAALILQAALENLA